MRGRTWIPIVIVLTFTLLSAAVYGAGNGIAGENQKITIFGGEAELLLKEGSEFFDSNSFYQLYYEEGEIPIRDDEDLYYYDFAYIFPVSENESWSIYLNRGNVGRIEEIESIDNDRLLKKTTTTYDNVEFYNEPSYDQENHKWAWCIKGVYSWGEPFFIYDELFFTREGYLQMQFIYDGADADLDLIQYAEGVVSVLPGNAYEDFDPGTDNVSDYDYISMLLYGETDSSRTDNNNSTAYNSTTLRKTVATAARVFIAILTVILALLIKRKQSRPKKEQPRPARKSINEKTPFRIRKSHDVEGDLEDNRSYYLKMREEEERNARKYD